MTRGFPNSTASSEMYVLKVTNSKPVLEVSNGTIKLTTTAASNLSTGTWYHLVGVYNGNNTVIMYVNSVATSTVVRYALGILTPPQTRLPV